MRNFKFTSIFVASLLVTVPTVNALAQPRAERGSAIERLLIYIRSAVNTTVSTVANYVYEPNTDLATSVKLNKVQDLANKMAKQTTHTLATCQVYESIKNLYDDDVKNYSNSPALRQLKALCSGPNYRSIVKTDTQLSGGIIATDSIGLLGSGYNLSSYLPRYNGQAGRRQISPAAGNSNFNFQDFISKKAYATPEAYQRALNFVTLAGDLYFKPPLISLRNLTDDAAKNRMSTNPRYQAYQAKLRSYLTRQSLTVNTLLRAVAVRKPEPNIRALGLKDNDGTSIISVRQLNEYLATRRAKDPVWYQRIATASSTSVARESLIVLAGIQKQLQQLHEDNEHMLALLSVISIQANAQTRTDLQQSASMFGQTQAEAVRAKQREAEEAIKKQAEELRR